MSDEFTIYSTTPPADLPHKTRQLEITELPEYLKIRVDAATGTERVLMDPSAKADNLDKIYIARNDDESINSLWSHAPSNEHAGADGWVRWQISTDDISEDALDTTLYMDGGVLKIFTDGETLLTNDADTTDGSVTLGKTSLYAEPRVDGETIKYVEIDNVRKLVASDSAAYFSGGFAESFTLPGSGDVDVALTINKRSGTFDVSGGKIKITVPGVYSLSYHAYVQGFGLSPDAPTGYSSMAMWLCPIVYKESAIVSYGGLSLRSVYYPALTAVSTNDPTDVITISGVESTYDITLDGAAVVLEIPDASEDTPYYIEQRVHGWAHTPTTVLTTVPSPQTAPGFNLTNVSLVRVGSVPS